MHGIITLEHNDHRSAADHVWPWTTMSWSGWDQMNVIWDIGGMSHFLIKQLNNKTVTNSRPKWDFIFKHEYKKMNFIPISAPSGAQVDFYLLQNVTFEQWIFNYFMIFLQPTTLPTTKEVWNREDIISSWFYVQIEFMNSKKVF